MGDLMAQAKRAGEQELSSKRGQQAQQSSEAHRANPSGKCEATSALLPPSAKLECRGVLTRGGPASAPARRLQSSLLGACMPWRLRTARHAQGEAQPQHAPPRPRPLERAASEAA